MFSYYSAAISLQPCDCTVTVAMPVPVTVGDVGDVGEVCEVYANVKSRGG